MSSCSVGGTEQSGCLSARVSEGEEGACQVFARLGQQNGSSEFYLGVG